MDTSRYVPHETQGNIIERWVISLLHFKNKLYKAENRFLFERYFKHVLIDHVRLAMKRELEDTTSWNLKKFYKWMFYFGVRWGDRTAKARSRRVIRQFLKGDHVNIVYLAFCLRFYRRVKKSWGKIFKLLTWYPRSIKEYEIILAYVCQTRNPKQQLYILNYSKRSQIMPRALKKRTICYVASRNPGLTWKWFKKNYNYYFEMYGESQFSFDSLLMCVTSGLETRQQYEDVTRFFTKNSSGTGKAGLKRGMARITKNMAATRDDGSQSRRADYDEIFAKFIKGLNDGEIAF